MLSQHPLFGLGLNNFSVYYEFVTGRDNFGPHSFYVALFVETGIVGALLFLAFLGYLFQRLAVGRAVGRALAAAGDGLAARVRPLEWGLTAALVGTMASNFFYLTMSFYYFFVFAMLAIVAPAVFARRLCADVRVCVLTTSYPRHPGDVAGLFVEDAVEHLREAGVEVDVVSPASFRHFGIAYGDGIANNLRARPWRVLLLPLFLLSFARAARRAARDADVVHAHWLPVGRRGARHAASRSSLQAWGSDVELAKRLPWLFRPLLRRARVVVCASSSLAADARALGARDVRVIPSGIDVPAEVGAARRAAARPLRRAALGGEGHPRARRGGRRPAARRRRRRAAARPRAVGRRLRPARRARPVLRAGRRRLRAVAARGVRRRRARGDGVRRASSRPASAASPTRSRTASRASSCRRGDAAALRAALERLLADPALRERLGAAARDEGARGVTRGSAADGGDDRRLPRTRSAR